MVILSVFESMNVKLLSVFIFVCNLSIPLTLSTAEKVKNFKRFSTSSSNPILPNMAKKRYFDSFGLKYCWKSDLFLF